MAEILSVTEKQRDSVWPVGKKHAYYACFIVMALGFFDLMDRMVLAALFPYLKAEWQLTDTQLGSLMSVLNFAIAVLVVPSAYFIDKWSRKKMIMAMGLVWGVASGLCAFAGSFAHLLVLRVFIGAGEAGYNPAGQSLLAASFPKNLRTTAMGFSQLGMSLGTPFGLILGAFIASHWGWRHAFGIVAIPGIFLAFLALGIKDYKNQPVPTKTADPKEEAGEPYIKVLFRLLKTPSLLCIYLGAAIALLYMSTIMSWLPSYYSRVGGMSVPMASNIAALGMFVGALAVIVFAPLVDWLRKRSALASPLWLITINIAGFALSYTALTVITPGSVTQVVMLTLAQLLLASGTTVGCAMITELSAIQERATAISLLVVIQNVFGQALGPVVTGILSDRYDLGTAMSMICVALLIAIVLYIICTFTFRRDMGNVKASVTVF